jgi:L-seryl-tRNA(Ser) seleniumtransferase
MQAAALESVLVLYVTGRADEVPVRAMVYEALESVKRRAQLLSETIGGELEHTHVERCESVVGGGSLPGATVPSYGVVVKAPDAVAFTARLRTGSPPVFGRVEEDRVILDVRTVTVDQVPHLARAVLYALEGDDFEDD